MNLIEAVKKCQDGKRGFAVEGSSTNMIFVVNITNGLINLRMHDGSLVTAEQYGKRVNANWNPRIEDLLSEKWRVVEFDEQKKPALKKD